MARECSACQRPSSNTLTSKDRMLVNTVTLEKSCDSLLLLWQTQPRMFYFPSASSNLEKDNNITDGPRHIVDRSYFWCKYFGIVIVRNTFFHLYKSRNAISQRAPGNWPMAWELQVVNHSFQTCLWELSVQAYGNLRALQYTCIPWRALQALPVLANTSIKCCISVLFSYKTAQLPMTALSEHALVSRSRHGRCTLFAA